MGPCALVPSLEIMPENKTGVDWCHNVTKLCHVLDSTLIGGITGHVISPQGEYTFVASPPWNKKFVETCKNGEL